ncbi:MAG TPA: hypothetical protein V6D05_04525 [Stenomitos sp.]
MSRHRSPACRLRRPPANWWVILLACAVTYLYCSLPFGNPHLGFLPPMGAASGHLAPGDSPGAEPHAWLGPKHLEIDDAQVWAALEESPSLHLAFAAVLPVLWVLVWPGFLLLRATRRQRAPPLAPTFRRFQRGPPVLLSQPWRLGGV